MRPNKARAAGNKIRGHVSSKAAVGATAMLYRNTAQHACSRRAEPRERGLRDTRFHGAKLHDKVRRIGDACQSAGVRIAYAPAINQHACKVVGKVLENLP